MSVVWVSVGTSTVIDKSLYENVVVIDSVSTKVTVERTVVVSVVGLVAVDTDRSVFTVNINVLLMACDDVLVERVTEVVSCVIVVDSRDGTKKILVEVVSVTVVEMIDVERTEMTAVGK